MRVLHVQRVQQSSKPAEMLYAVEKITTTKNMKIEKKPTCIDTAVAEADRLPAACAANAWAATAALNIWKYINGQGKIFWLPSLYEYMLALRSLVGTFRENIG